MDDPTTGLAGAVIEIRGIDVAFGPTRVTTALTAMCLKMNWTTRVCPSAPM